jgi:hypothetical protein
MSTCRRSIRSAITLPTSEKKKMVMLPKLIQAQQEGGMAQFPDQPGLRHNLHPCADARHAGTHPH